MSDIPDEFKCPITLSIMEDPVIMPDGQTYEREAIANHLKFSPLSPLTRQRLQMKDAIPNYAIKSMIEKFLNRRKIPVKIKKIVEAVNKNKKNKIKLFNAEVIEDPKDNKNVFVNLSLEHEKIESRKPLVLIAMIDVSGSMSVSSSKDMKGGEEVGISRLGLVKHSLKTIASILNENDKMSLITFNEKARLCKESIYMDERGKNIMFYVIESSMRASGKTNIWDALKLGMLEAQKYKECNTCLLLFTDGEPNVNPPKGIIPTLKESLSTIKDVNFTISTFAFGYKFDSKLMEEIAQIGNGIYGYCLIAQWLELFLLILWQIF